jgi:hypothetical protein
VCSDCFLPESRSQTRSFNSIVHLIRQKWFEYRVIIFITLYVRTDVILREDKQNGSLHVINSGEAWIVWRKPFVESRRCWHAVIQQKLTIIDCNFLKDVYVLAFDDYSNNMDIELCKTSERWADNIGNVLHAAADQATFDCFRINQSKVA